jgi:hypothetical protein
VKTRRYKRYQPLAWATWIPLRSIQIIADLTATGPETARVAIPPFEAVPIDPGYILGG